MYFYHLPFAFLYRKTVYTNTYFNICLDEMFFENIKYIFAFQEHWKFWSSDILSQERRCNPQCTYCHYHGCWCPSNVRDHIIDTLGNDLHVVIPSISVAAPEALTSVIHVIILRNIWKYVTPGLLKSISICRSVTRRCQKSIKKLVILVQIILLKSSWLGPTKAASSLCVIDSSNIVI